MTFQDKIRIMVEDLEKKGIKKRNSAPIVYRWLWNLNIKVHPPLFLSNLFDHLLYLMINIFIFVLFFNFVIFLYGLTGFGEYPNIRFFITSVFGGVLVSIIQMIINKYKSKKLGLPKWNKYINRLEEKDEN